MGILRQGSEQVGDESGNRALKCSELSLSRFETSQFDPNSVPLATRTLSAMPAIIPYLADLFTLYRREDRGTEIHFVSYNSIINPRDLNQYESFQKDLDAFEILDAFLKVKTPDEALHFLRDTGTFSSGDSRPLTWFVFRRWQRFAHAMRNADSRRALLSEQFPSEMPESLRDVEDLEQLRLLVRGSTDHTYLGHDDPEPHPGFGIGYLSDIGKLEPRVRTPSQRKSDIREFVRHEKKRQCELSQQFIAPRAETYRIMFPKITSGDSCRPYLVFDVHSTLEAIAAAIYVELVAGIVWSKCPVCGNAFKVGSQKNKQTCSRKCQDANKKRKKRTS